MAEITNWVKKIWKNRTTEFPTRRTLMKEDGSSEIVTVTRNEGTVSEEGDAFDADTMNNLEERIDAGFTEVNGKLHEDDTLFNRSTLNGSIKNSKLKTGIYTIGSEATDIPSGFDSAGILIVIRRSIYYTEIAEMLYLHYIDAYGKSAHCVYFNGTWTQWI